PRRPTRALFPYTTLFRSLAQALQWVTSHPQDHRVLNVNVPDVPRAELKGVRSAQPAQFTAVADERQRQIQRLLFQPFAESQVTRSEEHTSELQSRFDLVC